MSRVWNNKWGMTDTENQDELDEAALSEMSRETLLKIREKTKLEKIPDKDLSESKDAFSKKRVALNRLIKRPTSREEVDLMKGRVELRDRLDLIIGTIEGELAKRKKSQSWNF